MFYSLRENRRKRWYSLLTFGPKKLMALAGVISLLVLSGIGVLAYYTYRALDFDIERVVVGTGESVLFDADHKLIGSLSVAGNQYAAWDELPEHLINAFLAREDENFFEHSGIVYSAVVRALLRNIVAGRSKEGASTITMQLTRNVFELSDKSLDRKMLEAALAQRVEKRYDKATIFTQYVNRIYYGENCYGIARAAAHYFGKPVRELNLVECATLAGLVRGPSIFNPCNSMEGAMTVKRETLERMLEQDYITQEQYDDAVAAPIELASHEAEDTFGGSYAILWANRELEGLQSQLGENAGGIAVVSNLKLPVQQYAEVAMERALQAVENPGRFPAEWEPLLGGRPVLPTGKVKKDSKEYVQALARQEAFDAQVKSFAAAKRPESLKVRKQNNDLKGLLQCCVLVVDNRRSRCGSVLAVIGGRSAADGVDRWQGLLRPGRAAAPLVFCCACLPGQAEHHIVARSAEVTGQRIGYDVVRTFMDGLKLGLSLPGREQENDLYNGLYEMKRRDLAQVLFSLMNYGKDYRPRMIHSIWSRNRVALYSYQPESAPEYILRQSAVTVSKLAPFSTVEGKPTTLNETLPDNRGQFSMVSNRSGVCTFVWMGFDDPAEPAASTRELQRLLSRASLYLAREIHEHAVSVLRAEREAQKKAEEEQRKKEAATAA